MPLRVSARPSACIPCRERKVGCDQARPTCARCRKRRQATKCTYTSSQPTLTSPSQQSPHAMPITSSLSNGYMGTNNACSVLDEIRLQKAHDSPSADSLPRLRDIPQSFREKALFVLSCLPGQSNEHMTFSSRSPDFPGWVHLAVYRIAFTIEDLVGKNANLDKLVDIISANTSIPIQDEPGIEWIGQFCDTLRWESLGLLWAHLERLQDAMDTTQPRQIGWIGTEPVHDVAFLCLDNCIELSLYFNEGSTLLVDLCRRREILQTVLMGDGTLACNIAHGGTVAMAHYIGLHAQPNDHLPPNLCTEQKRRIFAQIFTSDKLNVSLTGRPPLIGRRYCSTPLLLDIPDRAYLSDDALQQAVESLDEKGWNTVGKMYSSTVIRARYKISVLREEILELAWPTAIVTLDHLESLKTQQIKTTAEFPSSMAYNPDEIPQREIDESPLFCRTLVRLEHLQNLFLVERLMLRHGKQDEGDILTVSYEMLLLALGFWKHQDRYPQMWRQFTWLVMCYAAPAGGILCKELIRLAPNEIEPQVPSLTRSVIVQNLSLLVGFLDWVPLTGPNGSLCAYIKAVIQGVLDQHLNRSYEKGLSFGNGSFPGQLDFDFELLDTFDWLQNDL